jgi:hypothetical protein
MKKMLILAVIVSMAAAGSLFAQDQQGESVLIDFTRLAAGADGQNADTLVDFSTARFPDLTTSLAIGNWDIELAPSARTIMAKARSLVRESPSQRFGTVMGVRVNFPTENIHSWATIKPPFEIPAYEADADGNVGPSRFQDQLGVVNNVAAIRSIAVSVFGMNFPHSLNVILLDESGNRRVIPMGSLNFDDWGVLTWNNPAYVQEVRNRDLRIVPVYPDSRPFVKFGGFEIRRDASKQGGDFITYFKDVKIIYDRAVLDADTRDINDEDIWGIIGDRERGRMEREMERFGQKQILRHLEAQRQAPVGNEFFALPDNNQ